MHLHQILSTTLLGQALTLASANDGDSSSLDRRHIKMTNPSQDTFDNQEWGDLNPLAPDGSNFPCRPRKGLKLKVKGNPMSITIGAKKDVTFEGTAVHGGGSCQFSLCKGHDPSKESEFYVIKSIEGGCPKKNSDGNLGPGEKPDIYNFTIPEDFEPGDYTLAWTWINRIGGQPEYYMNCSPIRVVVPGPIKANLRRRKGPGPETKPEGEGAKKVDAPQTDGTSPAKKKPKGSGLENYPFVFMANLGDVSGGCTTREALTQQKAISFPHPGGEVEYPNGKEGLFEQPCDGNPRNKKSK